MALRAHFKQNCLLRLHEFSGLHAIEVNATGDGGIPRRLAVTRFLLFAHKQRDFLAQCVENPECDVGSFRQFIADNCTRVKRLHARLEPSKSLIVKLPIILQSNRHGQKIAAIDPMEVSKYLDLDKESIDRLTKRFFYVPAQSRKERRKPIDRVALAEQWRTLIASGAAKNKADLARKFGVSRAWISKVMRSLSKS